VTASRPSRETRELAARLEAVPTPWDAARSRLLERLTEHECCVALEREIGNYFNDDDDVPDPGECPRCVAIVAFEIGRRDELYRTRVIRRGVDHVIGAKSALVEAVRSVTTDVLCDSASGAVLASLQSQADAQLLDVFRQLGLDVFDPHAIDPADLQDAIRDERKRRRKLDAGK
jgi:hypothetical protein